MKKLLAAASAAVALSVVTLSTGAVFAADLPEAPAPMPAYKAPAVVAPTYSWTGFYLNAGGGYGEWTADTQTINAAGACVACVDQIQGGRGWVATAGGGFDYQFGGPNIFGWTPQLLVGLMGDYNYSGVKGTIQDQFNFITGSITERSNWAVGGRVGLIVFPQFLTYTNAGYTNSHFGQANMVFSGTGVPTNSSTPSFNQGGWFLGGGTETTLAPLLPAGWFLRSEYRYAYYGTKTLTDRCPGPAGISATCGIVNPGPSINFHPTEQTLTTSLIYKFNWQ
jgi:outer membrane immunogenic protein